MLLSQEHEEMRRAIHRFIDQEINPHVEQWEAEEIFPAHEVFKKLGRAGFLGITKPAAYGGLDLDYSFSTLAAEAWGRCTSGGVSMGVGVQTDMSTPALAKHGSDELKREFLAPAIAGDVVTCIGVSEEGAGSDVASIRSTARKDGGDYVINGSKMWITNGTQADWMCMLVNTGDGPSHRNKSLVIVPLKTKGVSVARKLKKLGMHASDTAQLFFEDVRVPRRHLIGEEGKGFVYQMEQFQEERLFAAAKAVGTLEATIALTIDYTRQRKAFGKAILDNQVVHHKLGELATEVEALKALTYQAVEGYINGEDVTLKASMAKLKAGRLCMQVPTECLQFWGGQGYMAENRISRLYRDSRLSAIGGGANEIMLNIIAKYMDMLPSSRGAKSD
jgi:citronellyl-CoA dehydrogenase